MQKQNEGAVFTKDAAHKGEAVLKSGAEESTGRKTKSYEELEFTDDFLFCKILESNPKLCKEMAEMITGEKSGEIKTDESQKSIRIIPDGHGVRFDVYLSDGKTIADIEMQTELRNNLPQRSRYYQSVIDIADFEKNTDYKNLKKSFIIFITLKNPFSDYYLRKYTFVNICREEKELELGDDAIKIFLTPDGRKGGMSEEMEALMEYVAENKAESDFTKELDEQIKIAKSGNYWRREYMQMRERMDAQFSAGKKEGIKQGEAQKAIGTAALLLSLGKITKEEIAACTGLSIEEVEKLSAKI